MRIAVIETIIPIMSKESIYTLPSVLLHKTIQLLSLNLIQANLLQKPYTFVQ